MSTCRHCGSQRAKSAPRELCRRCYTTASVRRLYPAEPKRPVDADLDRMIAEQTPTMPVSNMPARP